jgi:Fibronectin type III domain
MRYVERGFELGRWVGIALLAVTLAGCGDDESSSGSVYNETAITKPPAVADTAPPSGSSTTTTPPVTTPPATTPPATTPPATTPPSSGSASVTLSWTPPTANANGTPITNLAGYKIRYGTASQDYTQTVSITNPSLNRYVLDSLNDGTYYFAITAYNTAGVESALSGEISTTLD